MKHEKPGNKKPQIAREGRRQESEARTRRCGGNFKLQNPKFREARSSNIQRCAPMGSAHGTKRQPYPAERSLPRRPEMDPACLDQTKPKADLKKTQFNVNLVTERGGVNRRKAEFRQKGSTSASMRLASSAASRRIMQSLESPNCESPILIERPPLPERRTR